MDSDRIVLQARKVISAFDADIIGNEKVWAARSMLSCELRARGAKVAFLEWDITHGKGIDDWLAAYGPANVLESINSLDFERQNERPFSAKMRLSPLPA